MQIKTKIVSCHTADSKPVKQEVNGTVILSPLAFPGLGHKNTLAVYETKMVSVTSLLALHALFPCSMQAYFGTVVNYDRKMFITFDPAIYVINYLQL